MKAKKQTLKLPQRRSPGNKYLILDADILFRDIVKEETTVMRRQAEGTPFSLQSDSSIWGLLSEKSIQCIIEKEALATAIQEQI